MDVRLSCCLEWWNIQSCVVWLLLRCRLKWAKILCKLEESVPGFHLISLLHLWDGGEVKTVADATGWNVSFSDASDIWEQRFRLQEAVSLLLATWSQLRVYCIKSLNKTVAFLIFKCSTWSVSFSCFHDSFGSSSLPQISFWRHLKHLVIFFFSYFSDSQEVVELQSNWASLSPSDFSAWRTVFLSY